MDKKTKLIRKTVVTGAQVLDFKSMEESLAGDERELYVDRGYAPARKIISQKFPSINLKIMHKRKRNKDLELYQQANNQMLYARERARVEHVFAAIKRVFGLTRVRYRGLERVTAQFESLAIAYNFYRLGFLLRT